jgi:signal transduction histidine kinase
VARLARRNVRPVAAPCHTGAGLRGDAGEPADAVLLQLIAGLETRLAEEVAARQATQARLDRAQRMQALGQLASGIAHDFNNVLQAIGGALYLISKQPDDVARVARFAALAEDAAFRGAAITGRLLSLSRRDGLCAGPVAPAPLLSSMQELLSHTFDANIAITIAAQAGLDLPPLLADRGQLETVLINLATNARDAMPGGGVLTLSAALDGGMGGPATALAPGSYIQIAVADTGDGMDAATLARATEAFFTTKEAGRGTGLGLALALSFAEQSGGAMRISSAPGQGTTVRIWLPCAAATTDLPASVPTPHPARVPGPAPLIGNAALALTAPVN